MHMRTRQRQRRTAACAALLGAIATAGEPTVIQTAIDRLETHAAEPVPGDWLLGESPFPARVRRTGNPGEIVLTNGLVSRTFRVFPNAATVALDNVMTGESLLRAVEPESKVVLDGREYAVGGLNGQPDRAYLLPEWIDGLRADPGAFHCTGFSVGEPEERLAWKRVRHHAPDVRWPPAGVSLRFDYEPPADFGRDPAAAPESDGDGRRVLFRDRFAEGVGVWAVRDSGSGGDASFRNEGKAGEILTAANAAAYVERELPAGTGLVEALIDPGTDRSGSWGPGIALVWPERVLKFHLRPGGAQHDPSPLLGLWDGNSENPDLGPHPRIDGPVRLRLRLEGSTAFCDLREYGGVWRVCATVRDVPTAPPVAMRVGKMDRRGGAEAFATPGEPVRLRVLEAAACSGPDPAAETARQAALADLRRVTVSVHYELYDGIPCYAKWIRIRNGSDREITVNRFTSEILAAVEYESAPEGQGGRFEFPDLYVETEFAMGGATAAVANRHGFRWVPDPAYATQVDYELLNRCLLEVAPDVGPELALPPGEAFESYRVFVLAHDGSERERRGLSVRRLYRAVAPWVTENPLMMHVRHSDPASVRLAIDQCADVGFEMVILTFGSGFDIENDRPEYLAQMAEYARYASERGIEIGGYSLLASRSVGGGNDVVMPPGEHAVFGQSPCLLSAWGQGYFAKLDAFYATTGFSLLEHDGSYPGDACAAEGHPGHRGYGDSRYLQWLKISRFYHRCREAGVYLNVPDHYFLSGSSKTGMGYRETNWSLPRARQVIHARRNLYDGTWRKTPSMGWMFVPLTQYHGGGAEATVEPLGEHIDHYDRLLSANLAYGVQACYRGPRLYDGEATRNLVAGKVAWFRKYRDILESDVIHGRRADGRDVDWILHVNPKTRPRGLLAVFNPLPRAVSREIRVPLYYTGLRGEAAIREGEGTPATHALSAAGDVLLPVTVPASGMTWFAVE